MNQLIFIKLLIGSSVLVGGTIAGTYFGSKTTVEQYLNKEGKLNKVIGSDNWTKNLKKNKEDPSSTAKGPKSSAFIKIKSDSNEKWEDLKNLCKKELDKVHKVFWKEIEKIEENLESDLREYCFTETQS